MALILPARFNQQPQGAATLTGEYADNSALCFLPNSLHVRNLAKSNPGKILTRVSPTLKTALGGVGVGCSDTTHAFGDSDWINPIATSNGTGTGAFSLLINATLAPAAARTIPFIIRQNSGNYNTVLVIQNGYGPEGGSSGVNESGTVYIGSLDSGAASYRGLKLASALTSTPKPITLLYNRYADGTSSLWSDGVQVASNATGYLNDVTVGTAMMLGIGGTPHSAGFATPDPTHLIYSANRSFSAAESARLSRNPWQIFQAPQRKLWVSAGGASDHSLTGNGITTSAATLGTPALTQDHAVVGAAISTSAATLGTPAITQDHVITAVAITASAATLGTPALSEGDTYNLTATAISTSAATLGTPTLTQDHAVTAAAITASAATLGTPAVTQDHVITATAISTSAATLGNPALSGDAYNLTADTISTSAATLGTPALTQDHALGGGAIAAGSPTFGTPTLEQQHAMLANGITTSPPTLGTPVLTSGSYGGALSPEDIAAIADAVWAHPSAPTAASIADAVWAKALP